MLVLSRKAGEWIDIAGGAIQICVVEVRGNKVRIGIAAPPEVSVHRREVSQAIADQDGTE